MSTIIDPCEFHTCVKKLREFFEGKGFIEVHTQNRLSILAACEDPTTISTYNYGGQVWPLPQTGQMWLEYELLKNPDAPGFFCLSTFIIEMNQILFQDVTIKFFQCLNLKLKEVWMNFLN